jgi:hypothetical protein
MQKHTIYILTAITLLFSACTEVIDVDVPIAKPRLVIEASIDWEKGTSGNTQTIKLSHSTPYFDKNQSNLVSNASVTIIDKTTSQEFIFLDQQNGEYICSDFLPIVNHLYTLYINYNGENYTAEETLKSVSEISRIVQSTEDGFDSEAIELNMYVPDPADEENYYLIRFYEHGDLLAKLFDMDDEFVNGNEMKFFIEKLDNDETNEEQFEAGDVLDFSLYGISKTYFNYMRVLIEQSKAGGPFNTTPVALRGNCVNPSHPDKYAFGYFRLTQVVKTTYTIQ